MATIYVDFTSNSGAITGTWTFTNASTGVTSVGGAALTEVEVGNYIRVSNGTEWYRVTAVPGDNSITITPAFQQATITDGAGATLKNAKYGTGTTDAYCHINRATTDTVRTAGDVIKVRANQIHVCAGIDIIFDEDGTADRFITLKGCSVADDPWGDASDTKPIIDFSDTAFQIRIETDHFWKVQNLEVIQSTDSGGGLFLYESVGIEIQNCVFRDNGTGTAGIGLAAYDANALISDCIFYSNYGKNLSLGRTFIRLDNCVFNGGPAPSTDTGINFATSNIVFMKNCTFGVTTAHDVADFAFSNVFDNLVLYGRNVKLNSVVEISSQRLGTIINIEDDEQVHTAFSGDQFAGDVAKVTDVVRAGGAPFSMRLNPNSNCGVEQILYGIGDWLFGMPIYLTAGSKTVTVYCRSTLWTTEPANTEFYIELDYYGASGWATEVSNDALVDDSWVAFDVTVTIAEAGFAYLRAILKKDENGALVYIDPKPVLS